MDRGVNSRIVLKLAAVGTTDVCCQSTLDRIFTNTSQCRNTAVPRTPNNGLSYSTVGTARRTAHSTRPHDMREARQHRLRFCSGVYRKESRQQLFQLGSSSSDIVEQGSVPGNDTPADDDIELEPRPFPKVGDIVRYPGKWKGTLSFGEVRQLKRVDETGEWRAYVLGLEDIGEGQYRRKSSRKSKAEDITTLRPVRAFFVRSVNGFKVMQSAKTGEPRYISDGYELEGFELPKIKIDSAKLGLDLSVYEEFKQRLIKDAASFGAVLAFVSFEVFGLERGLLTALGAIAAVGYVILLEKTADDLASGKEDILTKLKGDTRFAMPVLLVGLIALKNYVMRPEDVKMLSLIPKGDFASAMLGFVAPSRLPLLYREIRSSLTGDELFDMLPGSIGQGRQIMKNMSTSKEAVAATMVPKAESSSTRIVVVSGPKCLGKTTLVNKILGEDSRLSTPTWCTTRPLRSKEVDGEDFIFIKQVKFEEIERKSSFLYTYKDESGESYGLTLEDVLAVSANGKVCVVDAERALVKALMAVEDVALIGVWVSLDSIEAIEDRIRTTLISRGAVKESPDFESEVRGRVRQSVNDIEFGVMSGVFDFTVINNSDEEESMETVRRAVEFATG